MYAYIHTYDTCVYYVYSSVKSSSYANRHTNLDVGPCRLRACLPPSCWSPFLALRSEYGTGEKAMAGEHSARITPVMHGSFLLRTQGKDIGKTHTCWMYICVYRMYVCKIRSITCSCSKTMTSYHELCLWSCSIYGGSVTHARRTWGTPGTLWTSYIF